MKPARLQKAFAPILIVLIIAISIAVGAGSMFAYQKFSTQNQERKNDGVGLSTDEANKLQNKYATPSPTSSTNETVYTDEGSANWKTYANMQGSYQLKYPSDYQVLVDEKYSADGVKFKVPNSTTFVSSALQAGDLRTNFQLSITYEKGASLSRNQIIEKLQIGDMPSDRYVLDGEEGIIFKDVPSGNVGATIIFVHSGEKNYTITVESVAAYSYIKSYVDQILSTFKFLE